jgi:hypothetical protein
MSVGIGPIEIQMLADLGQLRQDMGQAKSLVGNAAADMQRAAQAVGTALGAIGIGLSLAAIKDMVGGFIDAAESLHDLSIQTGVSVESLSALQAIGRTTGTSAETIGNAMNKLAKGMAVSNEESKGVGAAIKALGLDFETFKRLKPDDQMVALAGAMNKFEDGSGKSAVAMTLFGKEGAKLLPFMTDLANAGELVSTTTREQADMADKYNDALEASRMRTDAMKRELSLGLLPSLLDVQGMTQDFARAIGDYLGGSTASTTDKFAGMKVVIRALGTVMESLLVLGSDVAFVFRGIGTEIGGMAAQAVAFLSGDFAGAGAIGRAMTEDSKRAREELDKFQASVLGVTEKTLQAADAMKKSSVSSADNARELGRMNDQAGIAAKGQLAFSTATDGADKAAKAAADAAAKHAAEVAKLTEKLDTQIAQQLLELETGEKLSSSQKQALDLMVQLRDGTLKLTDAEKVNLAQKLATLLAGEQEIKQRAEALKAAQAMTEWQGKWAAGQDKTTESLRAQVVSQIAANDELRLGRDAIEQREIAQLRATATDLEWQAANEGGNAVLEEQARLLRLRADLAQESAVLKEAKNAAEEWKKTTDSIGQGLTDSLFRAFEAGRGFFSTLWEGIKNTFKTTALKLAMQPVQSAIGGLLGFGGTAANAAGAAGTAGGVGSLLSGGSALLGSLGTFGSAAGYGASALFGGTGLTALSGGASMVGAGSMAGGLGMMAGVLGPIALGLMAITALFKDHKASLGYGSATAGADGSVSSGGGRLFGFGDGREIGAQSQLNSVSKTILASVASAAGLFGGNAAGLSLQAATDVDKKGHGSGILGFMRGGSLVSAVQTGGTNAVGAGATVATKLDDAGKLSDWFASAGSAAIVAGLQQSDLAPRFKDYFGSVAAYSLTKDQADTMLATATSVQALTTGLAPLGGVFSQLGGLSVAATAGLAELTGGFDAFIAKSQQYVKDFYSNDEQMAISAAQVRATLKAAGIDTSVISSKADFRALVDSSNLSTAGGQQQLAALLNVSGQFAQLADYLGTTQQTLADLADMAPQVALLDQATAQANIAQQTADNLTLLSDNVVSIGDKISAAIAASQAAIEAGLAAVAANTAESARKLADIDDFNQGLG